MPTLHSWWHRLSSLCSLKIAGHKGWWAVPTLHKTTSFQAGFAPANPDGVQDDRRRIYDALKPMAAKGADSGIPIDPFPTDGTLLLRRGQEPGGHADKQDDGHPIPVSGPRFRKPTHGNPLLSGKGIPPCNHGNCNI